MNIIPEFSDGFWTGVQLACWTNSETPWAYFPKISIYLRDENSSRSFRITILPQLYIQPMMGTGLNYECYRFGISSSTNALVIGATVMEGFYVVFDRAQKRMGFAVSPCAVLILLLLLPLHCRRGPRDPEVVNDESSLVRHRWK
nr:beta-secretase 2-like [Meriones unguiculatus]